MYTMRSFGVHVILAVIYCALLAYQMQRLYTASEGVLWCHCLDHELTALQVQNMLLLHQERLEALELGI